MGDMMQAGAEWLDDQQRQHVSRSVRYQRGDDSVTIAATIGRSSGHVAREFGGRERWEARDYLVRGTDLVLAGEVVEPQVGDQIVETLVDADGEPTLVLTHEVLQPAPEEPAWRWSDSFYVRLRIHTKLVSRELPT